jgi:TonB-linked SusC/RagA family outer membrane protein
MHHLQLRVRRTAGCVVTLLVLMTLAPALAAQTGSVTGRVTAVGSSEPLPGAEIAVTGPSFRRVAVSRADGRYTIGGVPAGTYTVEARRVGYAFKTAINVQVGEGVSTVDFELNAITLRLEEVVVTGVTDPTAGVRVPFTVGRVNAEELPVMTQNAFDNLQGKVAGVQIISIPEPGSGVNIQLRTPTSISRGNAPLFVVDGVILSTAFGASTADISGLDIESIEVIKGAAAASLYGSRAAAGVIQIRTKRGRDVAGDQTRITVRSEFGSNAISRPIKYATQHHYLTNDAGDWVDAGGAVVDRENRVQKPAATRFQETPFLNPADHIKAFYDPGTFAVTTISLAQNTGTTNFYASVAQEGVDGVVLSAGEYRRRDFRLNLDHRLSQRVQLSTSVYHMRSRKNEIYGDAFFDLAQIAPDVDLTTPDEDGTPFNFQPDPLGVRPNPLYILSTRDDVTHRTRTLASGDVNWSPIDWFSINGTASYDRSDRLITEYLPRGKKTLTTLSSTGRLRLGDGATQAINAALNANFLRQFGDLTARASVRGQLERESNDFFDAIGTDFTVDGVRDLNAAQTLNVGQTTEEVRAEALIGSLGLDWKGKVILDGLVRRDGSSLFGPDEQHAVYYRVSAAYRMAEESWWPIRQISEFKLRASQGTAGGRPSFADQYETYSIGDGGVLSKETLGNRALKPERARETEIGLDLIAWDRVSLQLSYADTRVADQLVLVPLPAVFGFTSQWQNAGTIEGNTIEATLQAQVLSRAQTSLFLGLVFDRSRHEVTEFDRPCFRTATIGYRCAGESLGTMYGQRFLRSPDDLPDLHNNSRDQFQVNDDGLLVPVGPGGSFRDGNWGTTVAIDGRNYAWGLPFTELDATNQPVIGPIGNGNPDYNLGFNSTLQWRGLQVYGLMSIQMGGDVYNFTQQRMFQNQRSARQDQSGKPEDLKKTVEYYTRIYNTNTVNNFFVEDGTHAKLRELAVRYRLNAGANPTLARLGMKGVTLGLVGRNLLVISNYTGYDPEVGSITNRLDNFVYPQYRTITGSIEIEF